MRNWPVQITVQHTHFLGQLLPAARGENTHARQYAPMKRLTTRENWALVPQQAVAWFVEVGGEFESLWVGRPPGKIHIQGCGNPCRSADTHRLTPDVLCDVRHPARTELLIFSSDTRLADIVTAPEHAGPINMANVLHGFKGKLNDHFHRSAAIGWV